MFETVCGVAECCCGCGVAFECCSLWAVGIAFYVFICKVKENGLVRQRKSALYQGQGILNVSGLCPISMGSCSFRSWLVAGVENCVDVLIQPFAWKTRFCKIGRNTCHFETLVVFSL